MITARILTIVILLFSSVAYSFEGDIPITTDNRIKTYTYNPNEVYKLVLDSRYLSIIEFSKGEEVVMMQLGQPSEIDIQQEDNRIFIKPVVEKVCTNIFIKTNKDRTYQFDIISSEVEYGNEDELVYTVRFYYPPKLHSKK